MKNLVLIFIVAMFASILSSCAKKHDAQETSMLFSSNPFSSKSILATAD